jgi:hypothetical protein
MKSKEKNDENRVLRKKRIHKSSRVAGGDKEIVFLFF